tara:strand:+ start:2784 stop:3374 length:591 start_codon:yes stop_codon:yes gene_type:complete
MNRIVSTDLIYLNKKYRPVYLNPQFFNFDKRKYTNVRREQVFDLYFNYMKYMPDNNHLVFYMIYLNNHKVSYNSKDNKMRSLSLVKVGCTRYFIKENEKDIYALLRNMYGDFEVIFILKTEDISLDKRIYQKLNRLNILLSKDEEDIPNSKDLILFDTNYGLGEELIRIFINMSIGEYNSVRLNILASQFHNIYRK